MNSQALPPRWLIVVHGGKPDLYENLRESFEPDPRVEVILDRRRLERRGVTASVEAQGLQQRRRRQRRKPPPAKEVAFWQNAGFCVIYERVRRLGSPGSKTNLARRRSEDRSRRRGMAPEDASQN